MHEASFSEVIRVILIVLLIYFGLKLIIRWLGPVLLRYVLRRVGKKFGQQFDQQFNSSRKQRNEGDVTIEKKPRNRRKPKNDDTGEYIDYEEID